MENPDSLGSPHILNQWEVVEGKKLTKWEFCRVIKKLRKYRRYKLALGLHDRQVLDDVEKRELLIDYVGHRCCWGSHPTRTWLIRAVEDCNVYVGTLDTFIEERETITETKPYLGGKIDRKDNGPELRLWEMDLRPEFPLLFIPHKETRAKIPHSEATEKCSGDWESFGARRNIKLHPIITTSG